MSAQLNGLAYGYSLAYPRAPQGPVPGPSWTEQWADHLGQARTLWSAAFSCPEGQEQDRLMVQAVSQERAAARCLARSRGG